MQKWPDSGLLFWKRMQPARWEVLGSLFPIISSPCVFLNTGNSGAKRRGISTMKYKPTCSYLYRYTGIFLAILYALTAQVTKGDERSFETFVQGKDYQVLALPVQLPLASSKVIVIEFFWYGCPHCFSLETSLRRWNVPDTATLVKIPAPINRLWELHAATFFALQRLHRLEDLHLVVFEAIHLKEYKLRSPEKIAEFLLAYGIPPKRFLRTMSSFAVKADIERATRLTRASKLSGVPLFNVNGKYTTSPKMAKSIPRLFRILDFLIAKEEASL